MLGPDVAPRHLIPNPSANPTQLLALLGSQLVVTTVCGSTAGRVDAAGLHAGAWPWLEIAGLRLFLRTSDQLHASLLSYPAGFSRTVVDETGPHPDTGQLTPHVERWCPVCACWIPATPGPQEAGFWAGHAHAAAEHVTVTAGSDVARLHSTQALPRAARWLTAGADVDVRLEPCTCDAVT